LHESFQRNGDLWKFVQDLAINRQQPNSVGMRQRDVFFKVIVAIMEP